MKKCKKRAITLLEIMIVIFLIGLIGSVIGYNLKGSLEKGKEFKTKQAQTQLRDLLLLEVAMGASIEDVAKRPEYYLEKGGMAKNVQELLKDGWNEKFIISVSPEKNDLIIESTKLQTAALHGKKKNQSSDDATR